jgi:hypothetical protein
MLAEAHIADCEVGCAICPGAEHHHEHAPAPMLIAAE